MVVVIYQQRWRIGGLGLGSSVAIEVRVSYHPESGFRDERLDGLPLEDLQPSARQQLDEAHIELMRDFRRYRETTSKTFRRGAIPPPAADPLAEAERQKIQTALRLATLREEHWRTAQDDLQPSQAPEGVVTPFSEAAPADPSAGGDAPKRTTSVFRCDRNETTARIARLRQAKPAVPVAEQAPEQAAPGQFLALERQPDPKPSSA